MSKAKSSKSAISATHGEDRPLSALLSQALVAFTIEFDNEFERRMGAAGYSGQLLSMVVWLNVIRFIPEGELSVEDLAARAFSPHERTKFMLGCLERWGFIVMQPDPTDARPIRLSAHRRAHAVLRDGWGCGRGIRANWIVRLTAKGLKAKEIWPPLFDLIEQRWQTRFGTDEITSLRTSLQAVVSQLEIALPRGLPEAWQVAGAFSAGVSRDTEDFSLPTLLSQLLHAFTIEFDRESPAPLALCANVLRILGEAPLRVGEIARLTGGSPETTSIGWQLKPYVVVEPDPTGKRGQVARLTPRGLQARQTYPRLAHEIEQRWEARYGQSEIRRVRESLRGLLNQRKGDRLALSEGLAPPPGVVRAGVQIPSLGRRVVSAAARQRMRDLVVQTEAFVRDPIGTLPHYPLWDMNRGFGP